MMRRDRLWQGRDNRSVFPRIARTLPTRRSLASVRRHCQQCRREPCGVESARARGFNVSGFEHGGVLSSAERAGFGVMHADSNQPMGNVYAKIGGPIARSSREGAGDQAPAISRTASLCDPAPLSVKVRR